MRLDEHPVTLGTMRDDASPFTRKLARLMRDRTARQVVESARKIDAETKLTEQAIYDLLSKGTMPRAATCLELARALDVPVEWLIDDAEEGDPPRPGERLEDYDLMREVARRFRLELLKILEAVELASEADTLTVAQELMSRGGQGWPPQMDKRFQIAAMAPDLFSLMASKFNADATAWHLHDDLPGSDRNPNDLLASAVSQQLQSSVEGNIGLMWIARYRELMAARQSFPERRDHHADLAARYTEAIKAGKAPDPLDAPMIADAAKYAPGSAQARIWRDRAIHKREDLKRRGLDF